MSVALKLLQYLDTCNDYEESLSTAVMNFSVSSRERE